MSRLPLVESMCVGAKQIGSIDKTKLANDLPSTCPHRWELANERAGTGRGPRELSQSWGAQSLLGEICSLKNQIGKFPASFFLKISAGIHRVLAGYS